MGNFLQTLCLSLSLLKLLTFQGPESDLSGGAVWWIGGGSGSRPSISPGISRNSISGSGVS